MPTPNTTLPPGWPRISSALFYDDAAAAIEWLEKAFGFETRLRVEDGAGGIVHSELELEGGLVMVASARDGGRSPRSFGGANTQSLFVYVDDADAHCARARAHGARIVTEPSNRDYDDWEDRTYEALDCEGHRWWFGQRVRTRS
jgi:uncharacterized glyoxalase superfamily protein PhnB